MSLALGGDCLADVAVLCAQPELAGPVAFDPVISRLVSALAAGRAAGDPHSPGCLWVPKILSRLVGCQNAVTVS